MKFLLDQGLARSTVQHLRAIGLDAEHVGPLGLAAATDEAILNEGRLRDSVGYLLAKEFEITLES
jgi:predicted nuclease of predicted toxin-antitoxin system